MGAPKKAVMAETGSSTGLSHIRAIMSHKVVTAAPVRHTPGTRTRLSEVPKVRRAMWGTAKPMKATGPAMAVTKPAKAEAVKRM